MSIMSALSHKWAIEIRAAADELGRGHDASLILSPQFDQRTFHLHVFEVKRL